MLGVPPNFTEGLLGDITAIQIQKSARLYDAAMRYETEARTAQATPSDGIQAMGFKSDAAAIFPGALPQDAIVMGGTSGLELQGGLVSLIIKPI